ncbi:MAG TPA: EF-hand domain-containing protein, partial [Gemmataceae bacterium]|nr:EF-hand domain-containing protein [Gemmataceae bacterium]
AGPGTPAARPRGGAYVTGLDPITAPSTRPTTPAPAPAAEIKITDQYDMVVYAKHRPIRIRVTTGAEGKPAAERWRETLKAAFDFFDRDGDGFLSGFEIRYAFSDTGLAQLLKNGTYTPYPQDMPTLERLDRDGDRRISFDEFAAYYRLSAAAVMQAQPPQAENSANVQVTEALFKLLDRNKDGKLTRDEVMAIEALIPTLDADEDECLSMAELVPGLAGDPRGRAVQVQSLNGPAPAQPVPTLMAVYEANRVPGSITQRVLKEYDKDGDYELTPAECAFDPETFARLDTDGNGKLSGEELDAWRTGPPDLEVALLLGAAQSNGSVAVKTDPKVAEARGFSVRQVDRGRTVVVSGRQVIEFGALGSDGRVRVASIKQQFGQLFQFAAGSKGYVEERDLYGQNAAQLQFIRIAFDPADRNADGKLTQEEFDRYIDLQQSFFNMSLSLTPALQTPSLFQLLDENRDGKLGVRELRTAWDRLIALEPGGGDEVTRAVIQPVVSLRLTRSTERFLATQQVAIVDRNGPAVAVPNRGPVWFRKMDRNGDGDVSRAEFLGTKDEFDAIDTDHDGLISLEEAEAFDKKMRTAGK